MNAIKRGIWALSFICATACAQSPNPAVDNDPAAILEIGAAPNWSLPGGAVGFGPTTAVEVTPVENRLELEFGVTANFGHHATEWDTDLLFKKPWTISRKVEFMFGLGPEWIHTRAFGVTRNSLATEVALDLMFWPGRTHHFGWYLEPAYDYAFAPGHAQSIGFSGGLLIGIP